MLVEMQADLHARHCLRLFVLIIMLGVFFFSNVQ